MEEELTGVSFPRSPFIPWGSVRVWILLELDDEETNFDLKKRSDSMTGVVSLRVVLGLQRPQLMIFRSGLHEKLVGELSERIRFYVALYGDFGFV